LNTVGFLFAVTAAGLGGFAVLDRLGLPRFEAWTMGRVTGLVLVALPAWWIGVLGFTWWVMAGMVVLVGGALAGGWWTWRRRSSWREVLRGELVFWSSAAAVLLLRLDRPEILGTEKPMDLGILASLIRAEGFPPPDMWLAGETLPYYYWGALVWVVPVELSGLSLEIAYNLIVALIGGLAGAAMWVLGRRLAGSHTAGATAAFFALLAGTPDGLRQLLAGANIRGLDFWHSSRQVTDTITEFPLFTLWLGDLHPHLLSIPLAGWTMVVALFVGRTGFTLARGLMLATAFGVTWAANPWAMPPTLAAASLLVLSGDGNWHWPTGSGLRRWLVLPLVAIGGWLLTAPFHLGFHPPFHGVGGVTANTTPIELALYAGCLLIPAAGAAVGVLRARGGKILELQRAVVWVGSGAVILAAAASGRPTLVILGAMFVVLTVAALRAGHDEDRSALALAALGVFLLAVPEIIFVRDPYGEQLHRMNTVFKAYIQGWVLIAVSIPVLLRRTISSPAARRVALGLLLLPGLPHLVGMSSGLFSDRELGVDGFRWMTAADRELIEYLRHQPKGTAVVEAVGGAYTEYARLSAGSGVPAVLGWANHESVWRGNDIARETDRRRDLVTTIYSSGDGARIREAVAASGASLVAIGALERADFSADGLEAVENAGEVVFSSAGAMVVRFDQHPGEPPGE